MNEEIITKELQAFNTTDAAIAKLKQDYMILTVSDLTNQRQIDVVHEARMDVKKRRIAVTKKGEELRSDAVKFQKAVIEEVKRIVGMLEPIENHLDNEEGKIAAEKARIKAEEDAKEAARVQSRIDAICSFGASFNGQMYFAFGIQIPTALVKICTDEQFEQFILKLQVAKDTAEAETKAKEEALKALADRQAKIAAEQEAEQQRLAEIARKQAEESARIKDEQKQIADAKQKVLDDAKHAQELEEIRVKAVEQARIDVEAKIKRQVEEKAAADLRAKIEAEKKAARRPDREKLLGFVIEFECKAKPDFRTQEARTILDEFLNGLSILTKSLREKAEAL